MAGKDDDREQGLFATADRIGTPSGGGQVTYNELAALRELNPNVECLDGLVLQPSQHSLPESPFISDYLALHLIAEGHRLGVYKDFRLAHFYSGCFSQTIRWLKGRDTFISYTVPAHDRKETIGEFESLGFTYPYPHIKDNNLWKVFFQGQREADLVITPSRLSASFLEDEGCQRVEVIPHGCDLPSTADMSIWEKSIFYAGYLGQVGLDKGLLYLIKAWSKLNLPQAVLLLAGPGTKSLVSFIQREGNGGQFQLMGFVREPSLLFNSCHVYIQPSVCESWGIEVIEAFAHRRPAIVSNGAGASEAVTEGRDGFVFAKRSVDQLAERIDWCYHHRNQLPQMGVMARKKAEDYAWPKIRQRYMELWRSCGK